MSVHPRHRVGSLLAGLLASGKLVDEELFKDAAVPTPRGITPHRKRSSRAGTGVPRIRYRRKFGTYDTGLQDMVNQVHRTLRRQKLGVRS